MKRQTMSCGLVSWLLAIALGVVAALVLMVLGGWSFIQAVFMGIVLAVVLGLLITWLFCRPLPKLGEVQPGGAAAGAGSGQSAGSAASHAGQPSAAASGAGASAATAAPASSAASPAAASSGGAAAASAASASSAAAATEAAGGASSSAVKASAKLPGEEELAARKGSYTYTSPDSTPSPSASTSAAAAPAEDVTATPDFDGDGVLEGTNEGEKPEMMSGPRAGGADDLKQIKGIGPKLEKAVNSIGVYHFDQIASWSADEVAWVNANLIGFKGRVTRDNWVEQAKVLAAGGQTEFSKKVEKGGVYD